MDFFFSSSLILPPYVLPPPLPATTHGFSAAASLLRPCMASPLTTMPLSPPPVQHHLPPTSLPSPPPGLATIATNGNTHIGHGYYLRYVIVKLIILPPAPPLLPPDGSICMAKGLTRLRHALRYGRSAWGLGAPKRRPHSRLCPWPHCRPGFRDFVQAQRTEAAPDTVMAPT